ncbi:MAG: ATP-binding protein [Candidatus Omnitrophica bacterium]|nr:ATP-binding protein [Candidatus Omnitrophota bacterium]
MAMDPLFGSDLVDRSEILGLLSKRLDAFKQGYRQNVALLGARGTGKSFLLRQFVSSLNDPGVIPVFVEVPQDGLELFLKRLMGGCLTGLLKSKGEELPRDVAALIQKAKKYVPKTAREMRHVLRLVRPGHGDEALRKALSLPRILREEAGAKALVIFDSFDHLESLNVRDAFGTLGREIMVDRDTLYLVAASGGAKSGLIFREKLNLLFGNFETVEVENLNFDLASRWLRARIGEEKIGQNEINFVVQMTDAHPLYLKTLTDRLCELMACQNASGVSQDILFRAFIDELFYPNGRIFQYFHNFCSSVSRFRTCANPVHVVTGIALGHRKLQHLAKYLHCKISDTKKTIQKLIDEEIVRKKNQIVVIPDVLFRFWLKHVMAGSLLGIESCPVRRESSFKEVLEAQYKFFEEERAKDLPKRLEELFRSFTGDVISVKGVKLACPHFQDVVSKPTNGRVFPVVARSSKDSWLCQIASKPVTEEDIQVFRQDVKKQSAKIQRKVILALSGIDLNATLMAKDSKISIWDIKQFNTLLDIYDRPKIIL